MVNKRQTYGEVIRADGTIEYFVINEQYTAEPGFKATFVPAPVIKSGDTIRVPFPNPRMFPDG